MEDHFAYKSSFLIELEWCNHCNGYYNKKERHNCNNLFKSNIDIISAMRDNLTKVKPKKEKKK